MTTSYLKEYISVKYDKKYQLIVNHFMSNATYKATKAANGHGFHNKWLDILGFDVERKQIVVGSSLLSHSSTMSFYSDHGSLVAYFLILHLSTDFIAPWKS